MDIYIYIYIMYMGHWVSSPTKLPAAGTTSYNFDSCSHRHGVFDYTPIPEVRSYCISGSLDLRVEQHQRSSSKIEKHPLVRLFHPYQLCTRPYLSALHFCFTTRLPFFRCSIPS